ncbi:MAG: glycosyl hydrolase 2 galactose-binding domain-containing protein [Eubacterium sp.]
MEKLNISNGLTVKIDGFEPFEASAPFSDFGELIKRGAIENPLVCKDADAVVNRVEKEIMVIEGEFDITEEQLSYNHINICCNKIDTLCSCYINNQLAFRSKNAHIPIDYDIKQLLSLGKNTIKMEISSSVNYIVERQKEKKLPKNNNGIDGAAYIRKASCHFGWDWGPCVPYKYIDTVELQCYNNRIEDVVIKQSHNDNTATIFASALNAEEIYVVCPNGERIDSKNGEFVINNPELWWTHDISQKKTQPLYTVVIKNSEMTVEKKIGIRSISLNQEADRYGTNFQFVLNGQSIFGKGACVIPFAAIPEDADNSTVDYYLDLCVKSNFNMLRMWGGGEYSSDYLLERCDELGILIWQDFCYACLMYPFYEPDFLESCLDEARYNVKRMEHHPCLAVWCGNNELEAMFSYLPRTSEIVKAYIDFFYYQLPESIKDLTEIDYIPTSPLGDKPFSQNTADGVGDTHMWNVWHGLKPLNYYEKRYTRFMSEFGLESLPSMQAIKTFAPDNELDLASPSFMSHQKCVGGNEKMMFYLKDRFDDPVHFDDLPYLTGIVQAECVKSAAEHFRRNKGRCNGALFWQLNDVWCCPSWSSVDFLGVPKAMMFLAKNFFAPISVSFKNGELFLCNDTVYEKKFKGKAVVINGNNTVLEKDIIQTLAPNSTSRVAVGALASNDVLRVTFDNKAYYFDNVKALQKAKISASLENGQLVITSNCYTKYIYIDSKEVEENYFCLLPNEEKRISFSGDTIPAIKCENNIEFSKNRVKTFVNQIAYLLKPMNIANAFYYEYN